MTVGKNGPARTVITVARQNGGWAVEMDGAFSETTRSLEEARASAHKAARASQDAGRPCQVRVQGDTGFLTF